MSWRVTGKVVVVTGAAQGQGAAEARLLAAEGATVVGVDLLPAPADDLPGVEYRQLDVTDAGGWAALATDLERVDGLVANAGITWWARLTDVVAVDFLRGLAKTACLELGPRGIRVNTVHPGYIETPMTASAPPEFRAANIAETPLGRTGTVHDVAPLIAFLLSDAASFISGAEIPVDGGLTAHGGVKSVSAAARSAHHPERI